MTAYFAMLVIDILGVHIVDVDTTIIGVILLSILYNYMIQVFEIIWTVFNTIKQEWSK